MATKKRQASPVKNEGLEALLKQRDGVVSNIFRIKHAIEEKTISLNPLELECRLDILNSYIERAMTYQNQVECIDLSDDYRADLEDLCVTTKSKYLQIMSKHRKPSIPETSFGCVQHQSRLPNMRLPKFSGKYSDYKNFISLFENLVDNDHTLSDIEKFNHLLSCLSDEALGTVKAFQISERNYPKALASLKKVYDNNCLIFFDSISKLFDLPEINKPSASSLRTMIDTVSAIYDSLLSIGDDKNITNAILIHLVMSKVDPVTKSKWEEQLDYDKLPLWSDCETALNKRYQHISADEASTSRSRCNKPKQDFGQKRNVKSTFVCNNSPSQEEGKCLFCKSKEHSINTCSIFAALPVSQRFDYIKAVPACINCLKKGHVVSRCKASRCRVCNRSHHTLLHQYTNNLPQSTPSSDTGPSSSNRAFVNHSSANEDQVILATAVVSIRSKTGEYQLARTLLDSGSQINCITEELAQRLKLKKEERNLNLIGIGKTNSTVKQKLHATVRSRVNSHEFSSDFWIMRSISTYQPDQKVSTTNWKIPSNIELADPRFHKPQKIDLLLGAETFFELLSVGQIRQSPNHPTLQKTLLGWIVSGRYKNSESPKSQTCNLISLPDEENCSLDSLVQKFWELEEIPKESRSCKNTEEQQLCENKFLETVQRTPSGRFKVSLPFKSDPSSLGLSFETAKRRFLSLERRLVKDHELRDLYMTFMKEYLELDHMSLASNSFSNTPHYFIPHQCVLRPQSTSTKLRVVFDASCRTSSQLSLNDILMVGPTIQEELYSTLIRFRMHKYAITADITKMYRQVQIDEADRNFQLILWRENSSEELKIYKLNTVTYGTSPAPFLAIRCLVYLSDIYKDTYPIGSKCIRNDFYVDDLLTGADNLEDLEIIRRQVTQILESAGFELAKWFSNHSSYKSNQTLGKSLKFNDTDSTKTLGIHWVPKNDIFKFHLEENFHNLRATKRNILSVSARLFDPLGLLCPIVTKAKILLQELWLQKLDWDESIPMRLDTSWQNFKTNLCQLESIAIPRYVNTHPTSKCQIHGFADASIRAYGCCIYIRSIDANGVRSDLLTAKSKVAPLKTKSLPRLELCAAHLLAKLWIRVQPLLNCEIENVYFWTDSEITLHWIKTHSSTLTTFVGNRVSEIQDWSHEVSWRHVPSKQNPADIVSRGCNVDELNSSIWFKGPEYLLEDVTMWPTNNHFTLSKDQELSESKKSKMVLLAVEDNSSDILKFISSQSSYPRLLRIFVYMFRFVRISRKNEEIVSLVPTAKELNWAFLKIIEIIQRHEFSDEIQKLKRSQLLPPSFQKLSPFLHEFKDETRSFNLLRVGGRLLNAPLEYDSKFPLLMPKKSHFVEIYLRYLHRTNCHAGPKALVALLRQKIWLINAQEACSRTVRTCIHCFRYKPKLLTQIMGNLPSNRLQAVRPFLISGVDFCGPVFTTLKIRGRPPVKMYIAVFVCFTSKAVHLELVTDLTSDCFISCIKRFAGRRGLPEKIYCDNATNFVGANRKLREMQEAFEGQINKLELFTAARGIEFVFIPPRAPHFGGLWEAAVKSAKHLLVRTMCGALLTQEELQTVLVEVEAVLNSRPISPLSQDPNDSDALTPAHLLIGGSLRTLPPESVHAVPDAKMTSLQRWRLLCELKRRFWQAWSKDYILGLQPKNKWAIEQPNLAVGRLVVVHEDNLPPQQWVLGRIQAVLAGGDAKVRVADVKTANGVLRRPIHKLAVLPID